jgi:hypothetical protein
MPLAGIACVAATTLLQTDAVTDLPGHRSESFKPKR